MANVNESKRTKERAFGEFTKQRSIYCRFSQKLENERKQQHYQSQIENGKEIGIMFSEIYCIHLFIYIMRLLILPEEMAAFTERMKEIEKKWNEGRRAWRM